MRISTFVYADNWRRTRALTYKLLPRCTQNPFHKATVIHHLKYKRSFVRRVLGIFLLHPPKKSVSSFEIPGWDCIPLCNVCHENSYGRTSNKKSVHYTGVWKQRGELDNHNVTWFAWKLRIQFWLWAFIFLLIK
jgi:hypothetical protein